MKVLEMGANDYSPVRKAPQVLFSISNFLGLSGILLFAGLFPGSGQFSFLAAGPGSSYSFLSYLLGGLFLFSRAGLAGLGVFLIELNERRCAMNSEWMRNADENPEMVTDGLVGFVAAVLLVLVLGTAALLLNSERVFPYAPGEEGLVHQACPEAGK